MISPSYVRTMARYNAWQNANVYGASEGLSDAQRKEDRGAFFGSIHATLNHLLWADQAWLHRFGAAPPPAKRGIVEGLTLCETWEALCKERRRFDGVIQDWADQLQLPDMEGDLTWISGATGRELTRPKALLIVHLFNHQTHHRGQVHAMLTGFGVKPGVTDLPFGENIWTD
ncbi:MAG: DinB family protein [Proteobacteria bacterium]|nr:DinB family protein [Pseudomonadota bacterium]